MTAVPRDQALAILNEGMTAIGDLAARLDDEQFVEPKTIGGGDWWAKDLLGHLAFWEELAVAALADARAGKQPEIEAYFARGAEGIDEINAQNYARTLDQSVADVRARASTAHAAIVGAIETMNDDDWRAKVPYEASRRRTLGELLGGIVGAPKKPFDHASAHIPDLETYVSSVTNSDA